MSNGSVPWVAGKHPGLDLVNDINPDVLAIRGGLVIRSRSYGDWGNYVVVKQDDGLWCIYAHLGRRTVVEGEYIVEGTMVGTMGSSGNVTAAHLHLEIQTDYYNAYSHADIAAYLGIKNQKGLAEYLP